MKTKALAKKYPEKWFFGDEKLSSTNITPKTANLILGGKGAGLWDMVDKGVPVPRFMVLPTTLCNKYQNDPEGTKAEISEMIDGIIDYFKRDDGKIPLLSVRSGARVSMPGMMDTVLNVGAGSDECKSYMHDLDTKVQVDCSRRLVHMYGTTCLGLDHHDFEAVMSQARKKAGVEHDCGLTSDELLAAGNAMLEIYKKSGVVMETDLAAQLFTCIISVFDSWDSHRAKAYRAENNIPDEWGTAVVVQEMVFGNKDDNSGSGVLFTRDPSTGEDTVVGEYLMNAQGEDVVAGVRTPDILVLNKYYTSKTGAAWQDKLADTVLMLEANYKDMLDIEFTVESGELYILQVRVGKRAARAAVVIALDLHEKNVISRDMVQKRITRRQVKKLLLPSIPADYGKEPTFSGLPACAGVVTGKAVFTPEQAVAAKAAGEKCILIRRETSPDDIAGMYAAEGIVTATGGITSHAAVVARGIDKPCITGSDAIISVADKYMRYDDEQGDVSKAVFGDIISMDGATGNVWVGVEVPVSDPEKDDDLNRLIGFVQGPDVPTDNVRSTPKNTGRIMVLSQFLSKDINDFDIPTGMLKVIVDEVFNGDGVLDVTSGFSAQNALNKLVARCSDPAYNVKVYTTEKHLSTNAGNVEVVRNSCGLAHLLAAPTTLQAIKSWAGDLAALESLIAPTKIEEKFDISVVPRYELLSFFEGS